jgi:uridine kinase
MTEASRVAADAPAYRTLARALHARLATRVPLGPGARTVVGIAGESGSGKSVTAVSLARELAEAGVSALVLHQDDYFVRPPRANHQHRERDIGSVGPQEVDLARIGEHVAAFRRGECDVLAPLVDYPTDSFGERRLDFGRCDVLLVEGTYVLQLEALDARVFLEATHEDTAERRRARNRDIDAPFVQQVLAIEHEIIARQAAVADVVIARDFTLRDPGARA